MNLSIAQNAYILILMHYNVDFTSVMAFKRRISEEPRNVAGFYALKNCVAGNGGGDL